MRPCAVAAASRTFQGSAGAEHFITVQAAPGGGFTEQQAAVWAGYREALGACGLRSGSAVFRRFFLSDALNQAGALSHVLTANAEPVAVSLVQQPPLPDARIAMLAYHVSDATGFERRRIGPHHVLMEKNGTRHLWTTRLCAGVEAGPVSAAAQTREVFAELTRVLEENRASLRDHCVRTWIYIKDIEVFYASMVEARRSLFAEHGLTRDTHYIASTGIEGACAHRYDVVAMDAYSQLDLRPGQLSYLHAPRQLGPTHQYGVTFERGSSIGYADRRHYFISGTASIDAHGKVVHRGDVVAQLDRAIDNVAALLEAGEGQLRELMYLLVYLRDATDYAAVQARLEERLPGLPALFLHGVVCRPEWLVEIEGVAIGARENPDFPSF